MNELPVDFATLRCFVTLVEERGVTKAAERLGLSQPAVSHALARLRRHFADPLLVRSAHAMVPTPRALEIYDSANEILAAVERLAAPQRSFDPATERSTFVVTIPEYFERVLAPPLLARLQDEAPGITIELRSPNPERVREWLDTGEVDLRIAWIHDPWPESRYARLPEDRFVCIARVGHPVVGERLRVEDFFTLPHVRPALAVKTHGLGGEGGTLSMEQYLGLARIGGRRYGARRLRVAMLAQSFATVPYLVAGSDAIATVPEKLLSGVAEHLPIRVLRPPIPMPPLRGAVYWHERTNADPRHRWFRRLVLDVAREAARPS